MTESYVQEIINYSKYVLKTVFSAAVSMKHRLHQFLSAQKAAVPDDQWGICHVGVIFSLKISSTTDLLLHQVRVYQNAATIT